MVKKTICHVSTAHSVTDGRIYERECLTLLNNGFKVFLIAKGEQKADKGIIIIKFPDLSRIRRLLFGRKIAFRLASSINADIYHLHDPDLLLIVRKLKRLGKKVIFDSHENVSKQILTKYWIPKFLRTLISKIYRFYEIRIARVLDGVIVVTPNHIELFSKYNNNVKLVTNYPLKGMEGPTKDLQDFKLNRNICFAGGISCNWNHLVIIKALELIPEAIYTIAGKYSDVRYFEKLMKEGNRLKKIKYLGYLTNYEVYELYSNSLCGMALLDYEAQSGIKGTMGNTKLFEYMKYGLPVICSNNYLWKEIIDNYNCGIIVNPRNVSDIAKAIEFFINNPNKAYQMGVNGHLAFLNNFNWSTQVESLVSVYSYIIDNIS